MVTLGLEKQYLQDILKETIENVLKNTVQKEWLTLKEAAIYAGVSYNTFIRYREQGLRIFEDGNVKRVSKTEIDRFLNDLSY